MSDIVITKNILMYKNIVFLAIFLFLLLIDAIL